MHAILKFTGWIETHVCGLFDSIARMVDDFMCSSVVYIILDEVNVIYEITILGPGCWKNAYACICYSLNKWIHER